MSREYVTSGNDTRTGLSTLTMQGYGVGAFGLALANTSILFFLSKFLVDEVQLEPMMAGAAIFIGKLWDAVSDPVVGRLSDRTRTAYGVRRPWLAIATPVFATFFAAIWFGAPGVGYARFAYVTVLLLVYNTAFTAWVVPYGALTPAMTQSYDERTKLNAARMGWSMAGGIVAGIGFPVLREMSGNWYTPGLALALVMVVPLVLPITVTRRYDKPLIDKPTAVSLHSLLRNRVFLRVVTLFVLNWTMIAVLSSLVPYFVHYHLGDENKTDLILAALQLSALVSVPVVVRLSERLEKHEAFTWTIGSWGILMLGFFFVPAGNVAGTVVLACLAGPGVAAAHVIPWSMLPDAVDYDRVTTGLDRAGIMYGAMTFAEKASTAVALFGTLTLLQVAGYETGAESQPRAAVTAIRAMLGILPCFILVGAAVFAYLRPPMTRAQHRAMMKEGRPTSTT